MLKTQSRQPPPTTHYVLLTAPKTGDVGGAYVEVSYFLVRMLTYLLLLGFSIIVLYLILKFLGVSDVDNDWNPNVIQDTYRTSSVVVQTETEPLMHGEPNRLSYGTNEAVDEESGASSSSSEELYDEKLCVICYDEQRNSFFVPCGHCATCYDCAERIIDRESKLCPICRRLIHKEHAKSMQLNRNMFMAGNQRMAEASKNQQREPEKVFQMAHINSPPNPMVVVMATDDRPYM